MVVNELAPLSVASEPTPFTTTAGALLPVVVTVALRRFAAPPLGASTPEVPGFDVATEVSVKLMIAEFSACAPAMTKFNGVAELTIFVPPEVEITEPAPDASSPSASLPETVIDPPLIVATPPFVARTPSPCTPEATNVSLFSVAVAPAPEIQASTDWTPATSTLPRVVIVVPVTVIDEPDRSAATPNEPLPFVVTLPPLRTTAPPEVASTPEASSRS